MTALGDTVLYTLDQADVEKINAWRANFRAFNAAYAGHKHPHKPGTPGATGHVAHTGLDVEAGEEYPAVVTDARSGDGRFGLHVLLNGNDSYWATNVAEG